MFFRKRIVPQTPPSLVKFRSRALVVMIGAVSSVPRSDHVPELMNARLPPAFTDATADAVSWQAGAITVVPASDGDTSLRSAPTDVPGGTMVVSRRAGSPICSISFVAHLRSVA